MKLQVNPSIPIDGTEGKAKDCLKDRSLPPFQKYTQVPYEDKSGFGILSTGAKFERKHLLFEKYKELFNSQTFTVNYQGPELIAYFKELVEVNRFIGSPYQIWISRDGQIKGIKKENSNETSTNS